MGRTMVMGTFCLGWQEDPLKSIRAVEMVPKNICTHVYTDS